MRLSEAIRLGATMKPQITSRYAHAGGTCAIGAALEAMGYRFIECDSITTFVQQNMEAFQAVYSLFGKTLAIVNKQLCPVCSAVPLESGNGGLIPHLNDIHLWSRERIADFVELHEGMPVPAPEPQGVEAL